MRKLTLFFLLALMPLLLFNSCGSADQAEKTADTFFKHLIDGQFKKASTLVIGATEAQITSFADNQVTGKLLKAKKKLGFNTQIRNGVTTVRLPYGLKFQKLEKDVEVTLTKQDGKFVITSVQ